MAHKPFTWARSDIILQQSPHKGSYMRKPAPIQGASPLVSSPLHEDKVCWDIWGDRLGPMQLRDLGRKLWENPCRFYLQRPINKRELLQKRGGKKVLKKAGGLEGLLWRNWLEVPDFAWRGRPAWRLEGWNTTRFWSIHRSVPVSRFLRRVCPKPV